MRVLSYGEESLRASVVVTAAARISSSAYHRTRVAAEHYSAVMKQSHLSIDSLQKKLASRLLLS